MDLPFIIVSGTVGEDVAVEAMRVGVHDFLLKGQLSRLVPAIERELREAAMRAERRRMQEQLADLRSHGLGRHARRRRRARDQQPAGGVLATCSRSQGPAAARRAVWRRCRTRSDRNRLRSSRACRRPPRRCRTRLHDAARPPSACARSCATCASSRARRGGSAARSTSTAVLESSLRMAWNEIRHRARLVKATATCRGRRQRGAPRPGVPEPARQRRAGDPRGRTRTRTRSASRPERRGRHGRSRSATPAAASPPRCCARHLRPVLHDQAGRRGHGPGARHLPPAS